MMSLTRGLMALSLRMQEIYQKKKNHTAFQVVVEICQQKMKKNVAQTDQ